MILLNVEYQRRTLVNWGVLMALACLLSVTRANAQAAYVEHVESNNGFSGDVTHLMDSSHKTNDLIKDGISPIKGQFTSPDGIVYSAIELDRSAGKVYLVSPNDKVWKYQVSGLDEGTLTFTRVARQSASATPASGTEGAAMCTISHARGSSYLSAAIGYSGKSTKITVVAVTLENKADVPITLSLRSGIPVLRTAGKSLEAERILAPNWLPMAGGAGSTEIGCGGMEIEGGLKIDKDTWCGWAAIDKPGSGTGDHVSIPAGSATLTVTKGKSSTIKLLFPGNVVLADAELIVPECRPSPFRLGPRMPSKLSK
jgi:hypothetical protein